MLTIKALALITVFSPLVGAFIAGIFGKKIGRVGAHTITIGLMLVSFAAAIMLAKSVLIDGQSFYGPIYTWALSGSFQFDIGFLIDALTSVMMLVVTFVSLIVHVYSVGYMEGDPGYQRFFSYMSLFTFSMLLLVSANNFLQLFIGWEGVGLVSYLLIGFWFSKESAAVGSFKAFITNRVGDFGFILGIAAILDTIGSLDYAQVFAHSDKLVNSTFALSPHFQVTGITMVCILLFIGAMGKSAQMPLHVWLPESMEGPTPISALIHAATMVTAGVFMVARLSPLYELSQPALSMILVIGATGGLFLGLLAFVENDIKRVIAYSTMSQLGYMMAANGASAFSVGIFHLMTHACFKALLFLAAGSIIIAMHHEQDLRKMGNLKKYLPVTYLCFLIGALSLSAIPPFSGFYSKEAVISAVHVSTIPGAHYAYWVLLIGSFVTAYYIFRAFFMAFHTKERFSEELRHHIKERSILVWPLVLLAIPSVFLGAFLAYPMIYHIPNLLGTSVTVAPQYNTFAQLAWHFHGPLQFALQAWHEPAFWFALAGLIVAFINYILLPGIPAFMAKQFPSLRYILSQKYGFDAFNQRVFAKGGARVSEFLFRFADIKILDNLLVNGSGRSIDRLAKWVRKLQTGYLYHYAFVMILGVLVFMCWMII
jgi:NADH-quinone oxidoreductase subunit L